MKKLLLILLCLPMIGFGQGQKFEFETKNFPNQYIVLEFDSLTIEEGYSRVLEWINVTYNTPKKVIKSQLENKYIRIEAIKPELYKLAKSATVHLDVRYSIEFAFKNNRLKVDIIDVEMYLLDDWTELILDNSKLYNRNGKPKKYKIQQAQNVIAYFNTLASNLNDYLNNPLEENW